MIQSIIKKDLKRNRFIHVILVLFMVLSAFLIAMATRTTIQLFQSIDDMYRVAKPPHFMQMHVGDIDPDAIDHFARHSDTVQSWQIVTMLNIFSGDIWVSPTNGTPYSLADSLLDMGFVKQNLGFDYLLDEDNTIAQVASGSIGIPILLKERYHIAIGDTLTIYVPDGSLQFVVTAYVRDAQMNSALVSSTRFLISDEDFAHLQNTLPPQEYLIQFLLDAPSEAAAFQSTYEQAGLPANGQGITYAIIRLLSGFSGMVMATIFVMVSIALIFIVFLCLKFTIFTVIEEDVAAIGSMKAIGMSHQDIKHLYLLKYRLLSFTGCVIGILLAYVLNGYFTVHITRTFGKPSLSIFAIFFPIFAVFLVYLVEVHFAKRALQKIKKVSIIEAITGQVHPTSKHTSNVVKYVSLKRVKRFPLNAFMSLRHVLNRASSWSVMMIMIIIATIIMLMPLNILSTLKSPDFITYMGQSKNDIVFLVTSPEQMTARYHHIKDILDADHDVKQYTYEARLKHRVLHEDGNDTFMFVDHSSATQTHIQYIAGEPPQTHDGMALSFLNAQALDVTVGQTLQMKIDGTRITITVTGIYQDVTSGGYTAKMISPYEPTQVTRYAFYVNLFDAEQVDDKVIEYSALIGTDVKVTDMLAFVHQTFGDVITQTSRTLYAISLLVMCLIAFITLMFMKLQTVKDYSQIAIMKSLGFTVLDLRRQYLIKMGTIAMIAMLIGTVIANTFGDVLLSALLRLLGTGLSRITFIINPVEAYIIVPISMLIIVLVLTWIASRPFKHLHIIDLIVE